MYYLSFAFFLSAYYLNYKYDKEFNPYLLSVPFILINVFKYGAGTDYFSYSKIYDSLTGNGSFYALLNSKLSIEPGFRILNILSGKMGINYVIFSALFMSLITYFAIKWIFDDSENIYISLLLYFSMFYLYWNMSVLRQGIVLTFLTYIFFNEKKSYGTKTKVFSTLLMFTFHKSALIVPVFYYIAKLKWTRRVFVALVIISPISRLASAENLIILFGENSPIFSKILKYIDYNSIKYLSVPTLQRLFFIVVLLVFYDRLKSNAKTKTLVNYALANLIMYLYLPTSMVIGTRTTIFGYYALILLIPAIIETFDYKKLRDFSFVIVLMISSVYMYNELDKQKRNSHYNQSIHKMNFETIFNKNLNHYSNAYAVDYQIKDVNQIKNETSEIFNQLLNPYSHAEIDNQEEYLNVKFLNEELLGVINTQGEVVIGPMLEDNMTLFGPYARIYNDELFLNNYEYYHISNLNQKVNYDDAEEYVDSLNKRSNFLSSQNIKEKFISKENLDQFDFLNDYDLKPVEEIFWLYYEEIPDFSYIRLATRHASYYIILYDNQPVVDKLYTRIVPLDEKGIIKGYTHTGIDYINLEGNVIWFEKR